MQWTYDFFKYTLADESCLRKTATPLALLPAPCRGALPGARVSGRLHGAEACPRCTERRRVSCGPDVEADKAAL